MDSYLGDGTGTLDTTTKTSWDGSWTSEMIILLLFLLLLVPFHSRKSFFWRAWAAYLGGGWYVWLIRSSWNAQEKGLHFEAPSLVESGNSKGKDIRTEKQIIICTMSKQKHCDYELHSQLSFFSTNQPGGAPTTMITMWHLRPSYFAIRRPTKQP